MYGEVVNETHENTDETLISKKPPLKGWFPYKCVRVLPNQHSFSQDEENLTDELNTETDKKNE